MHQAAAAEAAEAEAEAEAAAARGGQTLLCRPSRPRRCVDARGRWREGGQRVAASADSRPLALVWWWRRRRRDLIDESQLDSDSCAAAEKERICTGNWLENAEFRSFEEFNFQVCVAAVPLLQRIGA